MASTPAASIGAAVTRGALLPEEVPLEAALPAADVALDAALPPDDVALPPISEPVDIPDWTVEGQHWVHSSHSTNVLDLQQLSRSWFLNHLHHLHLQ